MQHCSLIALIVGGVAAPLVLMVEYRSVFAWLVQHIIKEHHRIDCQLVLAIDPHGILCLREHPKAEVPQHIGI